MKKGWTYLKTEDLVKIHVEVCDASRRIIEAKNRDYTGGSQDIFSNFRASEIMGIIPEVGILNRCLDKFNRIRSFVSLGNLAVKSESVEDSISDVINYMIIIQAMIRERIMNQGPVDIAEDPEKNDIADSTPWAYCYLCHQPVYFDKDTIHLSLHEELQAVHIHPMCIAVYNEEEGGYTCENPDCGVYITERTYKGTQGFCLKCFHDGHRRKV